MSATLTFTVYSQCILNHEQLFWIFNILVYLRLRDFAKNTTCLCVLELLVVEHVKKEVGKHYGIDTELDPNDDKNYITIVPSLEVFQAKLTELTK